MVLQNGNSSPELPWNSALLRCHISWLFSWKLNHECLEWTLRPQSADDFAELVDVLAAPGKSGHQYLTCGVTDEITVMVSHGEYPENLRP